MRHTVSVPLSLIKAPSANFLFVHEYSMSVRWHRRWRWGWLTIPRSRLVFGERESKTVGEKKASCKFISQTGQELSLCTSRLSWLSQHIPGGVRWYIRRNMSQTFLHQLSQHLPLLYEWMQEAKTWSMRTFNQDLSGQGARVCSWMFFYIQNVFSFTRKHFRLVARFSPLSNCLFTAFVRTRQWTESSSVDFRLQLIRANRVLLLKRWSVTFMMASADLSIALLGLGSTEEIIWRW